MAGLREFFKAEQDRKRKLFKGEGYPESAAARAKDKAKAKALEIARAKARADRAKARADRAKARADRDKKIAAVPVVAGKVDRSVTVTKPKPKPTITNPRGTMRGRKFFPAPDKKGTAPSVKSLKEYTKREAERRMAETARLNEEHNAKKARRGLQKPGTFAQTMKGANTLEAARRAAETARLNKEFSDKEAAEKGEKKPWWSFEKGGLVKKSAARKTSSKKSAARKTSSKKSIDGIARKGKTRAKHR